MVNDIVDKYRKLFHYVDGQVGYRWLGDMADEIVDALQEQGASANVPPTAKGQNLPLDCIGIKTDSESEKTSAI